MYKILLDSQIYLANGCGSGVWYIKLEQYWTRRRVIYPIWKCFCLSRKTWLVQFLHKRRQEIIIQRNLELLLVYGLGWCFDNKDTVTFFIYLVATECCRDFAKVFSWLSREVASNVRCWFLLGSGLYLSIVGYTELFLLNPSMWTFICEFSDYFCSTLLAEASKMNVGM